MKTTTRSLPPARAVVSAANERPIPFYPGKFSVKEFGAKGDGLTGQQQQPPKGCMWQPVEGCMHTYPHLQAHNAWLQRLPIVAIGCKCTPRTCA